MASVQENRSKFRHVLDELAMQIYNHYRFQSTLPVWGDRKSVV